MEGIFTALAKDGGIRFYNVFDVNRYCLEHEGKELVITMKEKAKTGEKMRLYAFYHGPLLEYAVKGWRGTGEILDKVEADYKLRASFAKTFRTNSKGDLLRDIKGNTIPDLESLSKMPRSRLITYVQDCIHFIEADLQQEIPDSGEYKAMKSTGRQMRKAGPGKNTGSI